MKVHLQAGTLQKEQCVEPSSKISEQIKKKGDQTKKCRAARNSSSRKVSVLLLWALGQESLSDFTMYNLDIDILLPLLSSSHSTNQLYALNHWWTLDSLELKGEDVAAQIFSTSSAMPISCHEKCHARKIRQRNNHNNATSTILLLICLFVTAVAISLSVLAFCLITPAHTDVLSTILPARFLSSKSHHIPSLSFFVKERATIVKPYSERHHENLCIHLSDSNFKSLKYEEKDMSNFCGEDGAASNEYAMDSLKFGDIPVHPIAPEYENGDTDVGTDSSGMDSVCHNVDNDGNSRDKVSLQRGCMVNNEFPYLSP